LQRLVDTSSGESDPRGEALSGLIVVRYQTSLLALGWSQTSADVDP
jgi:hypothetical protein